VLGREKCQGWCVHVGIVIIPVLRELEEVLEELLLQLDGECLGSDHGCGSRLRVGGLLVVR
jgi:hypothetical protein